MSKEITVQIKVQDYNKEFYCTDYGFIPKSACTVISDPVDHVQPEPKYYPGQRTQKLFDLMHDTHAIILTEGEMHDIIHVVNEIQKEEVSQPEPKWWCIKRTPENAKTLNKWANIFSTYMDFTDNKNWLVFDIKSQKISVEEYAIEDYTEVFTVEEFFSKVGYTPESSSKEILYNSSSPKLIARAGDWVKIVDLGSLGNSEFTINKQYKLKRDLYDNGSFYACDDKGFEDAAFDINFFGVKFEVCPAPVQRNSIGSYEGVEIFEDTKAWYIDLRDLEIRPCTHITLFNWGENPLASKAYLSPKEADERLKEEVEKVAMNKSISAKEYMEWLNSMDKWKSVVDYAIELVEKEFNVKYLEV